MSIILVLLWERQKSREISLPKLSGQQAVPSKEEGKNGHLRLSSELHKGTVVYMYLHLHMQAYTLGQGGGEPLGHMM